MSPSYTLQTAKDLLLSFKDRTREFAKENAWVFFVFIGALSLIVATHGGDAKEMIAVFAVHFTADILIMMMFREYTLGHRKSGTFLQVLSTLLFLSLKIHSGLTHGSWQYLSADVLYLMAAVKNYRQDMHGKDIAWIDNRSALAVTALIMAFVYLPNHLIHSPSQWIQTAGIFLFAIALINSRRVKARYVLSVVGLFGMVLGSGMETYRTYAEKQVVGLALSYFILPTTVLVFYLKRWRDIFPKLFSALEMSKVRPRTRHSRQYQKAPKAKTEKVVHFRKHVKKVS